MVVQRHRDTGKASRRLRIVAVLLLLLVLAAAAAPTAAAQGPDPDDPFVTTRVLVRGGRIHGANGITFDSQNRLYVASVVGREILIMNPITGRILDSWGPEEGVEAPDDLVFGPDGSLYWADLLSGEVGRRSPDGTVKKQYVAPLVNPIAFSPDGRLFVAQAFGGDRLYEIDPELVSPPVEIMGTGNPAFHLNGMAFGPDGLLYAPRQQMNQVVRINVDTGAVEVLTDQFEGSCAFDADGVLHVAADDRVVQLDPDTGEVTPVATTADGLDNLAFDSRGRLYVSNHRDGTIHRITRDGRAVLVRRGGMIAPGGVAVMPKPGGGESIWVADTFSLREFGGLIGWPQAEGRDFFASPQTVAPDGENLVLSTWFGGVVQVWDPTTQTALETHQFAVPLNAVRFMGDLVVAEVGTGSVVRQDSGTGERSPLAEGLAVPAGLAYTDDDLWVADWATGMVWQIVADGVVQAPVAVASGLANPEGLAVDLDGTLLVVESTAGRLSRIDPATGAVTTVAEGLALGAPAPPDSPPTWLFNGVAVGRWGAIYVTGGVGNVVYRIRVWS